MAKEKNMNQDAANDEEMTVTLTLDDGTDLECVVLTIFEAADKEYIALYRGRRWQPGYPEYRERRGVRDRCGRLRRVP